eukprot:TRINITY_DN62881_c0_g1_i2.p1 TRINITY_DN62881_c0_g1~~TRINITY_DN62881_c0_g1_i2.p1  ORF type:complete len:723 (-),score=226.92 TRINITY_DN62881_c0_g1_i2:40-2208(-)
MGNSQDSMRITAEITVSPQEEASTPNLPGLDKHELGKEWKAYWAKQWNDLTPDEQKLLRDLKSFHKWCVLVRHQRETAQRFLDDAVIYANSERYDIAAALYDLSLLILDTLPDPTLQEDTDFKKKYLSIRNKAKEANENYATMPDARIPDKNVVNDAFKSFAASSRILERFSKEITTSMELRKRWVLYEYLQLLNSALEAQLHGDEAFELEMYTASSLFYNIAYKFYPSPTLDDALRAAIEESTLRQPQAPASPEGSKKIVRRRSSAPNIGGVDPEIEKINVKFNIVLSSKGFTDHLKRRMGDLDVYQKRDICAYFEQIYLGPIFKASAANDDELARKKAEKDAGKKTVKPAGRTQRSGSKTNEPIPEERKVEEAPVAAVKPAEETAADKPQKHPKPPKPEMKAHEAPAAVASAAVPTPASDSKATSVSPSPKRDSVKGEVSDLKNKFEKGNVRTTDERKAEDEKKKPVKEKPKVGEKPAAAAIAAANAPKDAKKEIPKEKPAVKIGSPNAEGSTLSMEERRAAIKSMMANLESKGAPMPFGKQAAVPLAVKKRNERVGNMPDDQKNASSEAAKMSLMLVGSGRAPHRPSMADELVIPEEKKSTVDAGKQLDAEIPIPQTDYQPKLEDHNDVIMSRPVQKGKRRPPKKKAEDPIPSKADEILAEIKTEIETEAKAAAEKPKEVEEDKPKEVQPEVNQGSAETPAAAAAPPSEDKKAEEQPKP